MIHETDEYDHHEYAPGKRGRRRSSGGAKLPLAIRAMAGEIAWLDGYPVWHGDRVAWQHAHGVTVPTGPRLALAQRRLSQIAGHPTVSARVFGDAAGWIAWHATWLHLAKQLSVLQLPELPDVAARARAHDRAAIRSLTSMLLAEAFCVHGLPVLPSSALAACGEQAAEAVRRVMHDPTWPRESRALAALVLGAIHAQAGVRADASAPTPPRQGDSAARIAGVRSMDCRTMPPSWPPCSWTTEASRSLSVTPARLRPPIPSSYRRRRASSS